MPRLLVLVVFVAFPGCSALTGFGDLEFEGRDAAERLDTRPDVEDASEPDVEDASEPDVEDASEPDAGVSMDARVRDSAARDAGPMEGGADGGTDARDARVDDMGPPDGAGTDATADAGPCTTDEDCPTSAVPCRIAQCLDGDCVESIAPIGTSCSDSNPCTETTACSAVGECTGGVVCPDLDGNPCVQPVCDTDPAGEPIRCLDAVTAEGGACGDGPTFRCCSGSCVDTAIDAANCGGCSTMCPSGGCVASLCQACSMPADCPDDGLVCTFSPTCMMGRCNHPIGMGNCVIEGRCYAHGDENPDNECEVCASDNPEDWTTASGDCDDGLACTMGDRCSASASCEGSPTNCNDSNNCTLDTCAEPRGCRHTPTNQGGRCSANVLEHCCSGVCQITCL